MNTLGYAILSILIGKPCSGYELASSLEFIWPAKHSQIYPQLSRMEEQGLVVFQMIQQNGKPNKKVYSVTEQGQELLTSWLNKEPSDPVVRDEFLIKKNSIWLSDQESSERLLHNRIEKLNNKIASQEKQISNIQQHIDGDDYMDSEQFGRYMLINRGLRLQREELEWCKWALNLVSKGKKKVWALGFLSFINMEEALSMTFLII
ncbi:PadR family transcriptional regulator [Domibacillus mangrovi]|uniref:PadR family transcriptional regulator n=1 Tax=Domibacillus mangrovi TaxID=1714354 RepID=A0A1Q5NZK0_9BACI|nr:PadR family transcriptional regulator [Domibacillus mangrovi]OKL35419.1 hypothetical protein BLL40_15320 [Domibacillus mangrovi]